MKHLPLFALVLSLVFSSCVPATQSPQPTVTPTTTPIPTATITLTPTSTESPTPDPLQLVINQLEKEGIIVDTTGKITYKGIEVRSTTFDAMGLHIQIGDQKIDIPQNEVLKRLATKEDSVVIYDKDKAGYADLDMNNWPRLSGHIIR